jgi:hypothetical protein
MRYLIPTALASLPMLLASNAFADPCGDAICSLAGHSGSWLETAGVLSLLAAAAVLLSVSFYRPRDRIHAGSATE